MTLKRTRVRLVSAVEEITKGTRVDPTTGIDLVCIEPRLFPEFGTVIRELSSATLSTLGSLTTTLPVRLEFGVEASRNAGSVTDPEPYGLLLRACGATETVGASDVTYTPNSDFTTSPTSRS